MSFLKKAGKFILDALAEKDFVHQVFDRPLHFDSVSFAEVKDELQDRIDKKNLIIKVETRDGWRDVGLVRHITETKISYSPHREHKREFDYVEITKNHTGKVVARAHKRGADRVVDVRMK
ncbi:hypothetical protein LZL36_11045 [Pseudomonas aeruginosa]|nr:hypothetical protein [Pseudomonas aeruginosa]